MIKFCFYALAQTNAKNAEISGNIRTETNTSLLLTNRIIFFKHNKAEQLFIISVHFHFFNQLIS
jgi:hypothetical protein